MAAPANQPTDFGTARLPIARHVPDWLDPGFEDGRLRIHIGGRYSRPGWKILDIQAGPTVDLIGDCQDLSQFGDGTVSAIYASHVIEHLSHRNELEQALTEIRRVLMKDGVFLMSVPDLSVLCELFVDPSLPFADRAQIMFMMFGGQLDQHDFHYVGLWREYLGKALAQAGFRRVDQVPVFGLFHDSSLASVHGRYISLNVIVS
jgi:predicted SAM-dependent methyltransferase